MSDRNSESACFRDRKRHDNHERLYLAALEEFDRVGYDRARIERICRKSNVTRPTFYAHFSSKEGVLSELHYRHFQLVSEELKRRTRSGVGLDGIIDALVTACFDGCGLVSEPLRREILSYMPRFQCLTDWEDTEAFAILVHGFHRARTSREIADHNPRELARDVVSIINGFLVADAGDLEAGARGARRALRLLLEGLRSSARTSVVRQRTRGAA